MNNNLLKLKTSLCDAIKEWVGKHCDSEEWQALDTHVSEKIEELMADSAFNVLLAQRDLTKYLTKNNHLKD